LEQRADVFWVAVKGADIADDVRDSQRTLTRTDRARPVAQGGQRNQFQPADAEALPVDALDKVGRQSAEAVQKRRIFCR